MGVAVKDKKLGVMKLEKEMLKEEEKVKKREGNRIRGRCRQKGGTDKIAQGGTRSCQLTQHLEFGPRKPTW